MHAAGVEVRIVGVVPEARAALHARQQIEAELHGILARRVRAFVEKGLNCECDPVAAWCAQPARRNSERHDQRRAEREIRDEAPRELELSDVRGAHGVIAAWSLLA